MNINYELKECCQYSDCYCRQASEKYLNGKEEMMTIIHTSCLNEDIAAIEVCRALMIKCPSQLTLSISELEAPTASSVLA